jgi:hypothetical protein
MKNILIVTALLLLITGNALAGSEYDRCIKEEKELKAKESGACGGLQYLLNPSGCFATRKALKEYAAGKCRQIGTEENVVLSVPKVITEKKGSNAGSTGTVSDIESCAVKKSGPEAAKQEYTIEQLKEENARLKGENSRLETENEQLRKTSR